MESVQLEHENVTEFVLVTLRDRVEEGRRFSNEEKDPMTSKELNEEPYEVKISCYHETKDLLSKEIRFGTLICPRSESNSNDSKHFFLHYFGNPRTQSYGYVKYRIFTPSRKGRETDTQFKVSKQNSILDLIDTYRILLKAVFDESRMYGLEGELSYLSRSTLQYGWLLPKGVAMPYANKEETHKMAEANRAFAHFR
ncbi:hypothetical protein BUALT_BualtMtG0004300 (mitochondrion) [Buddleja alternifolia]|uniref:Uncharacterized protein n=1 Tax=Buddleja alternifolia TaxID=168488 RepID=A0AAV6W612_9LAMI|nr:hypothetical protein BUALT_BualtMtG0004300 [Buddleja alternifolia]